VPSSHPLKNVDLRLRLCSVPLCTGLPQIPWHCAFLCFVTFGLFVVLGGLFSQTVCASGINVALAANGGVATASSSYNANYGVSAVNDGDRTGVNWGAGGGWNDATVNSYPDWVQIDFNSSETINEIDVFTLQDNYASPISPTVSTLFSRYGVTDFEVRYWTGTAWVDVPNGNVTGNRNVWRQFTFSNVTTRSIRVLVNGALAGYSRIVEIEAYTPGINVALAANGAVATASSEYGGGYPVLAINDGDRTGSNWEAGGGWNDATANSFPDWVQIDLASTETINEIDVFTLQDNYPNPAAPTLSMQFSQYGITDFEVQYWNGTAWVDVPGGNVIGNRNVWRRLKFTSINTSKIRVLVNNALASYSRIVEVEAYTPGVNVALAANGGTASASSSYSGSFPAAGVNNGDRLGTNWGSGGGWNDATPNIYPDWVQINFSSTQSINEIDVFTLQDNYSNPVTPTLTTQFSQYGIIDFQIQYWTGSVWVDVPGGYVIGNRNVWRQFLFASVTTSAIRVQVNNALGGYSRITEIEAYQSGAASGSNVTRDIWIALRADGLPGSGTQSDPYDGSSADKFDAILSGFSGTPNLGVHLMGAGPFLTSVARRWLVQPGWVISGDGMYSTTLKLTGNVAGMSGVTAIVSDSNVATDNVMIRDLTIDCNWAELSQTADTGINGEKKITVTAVGIYGSNNLLERVRSINSYGSQANRLEHFALFLGGSRFSDSTNGVITDCRAELPQGTYGNPFCLSGWNQSAPFYRLINSKVVGCTAVGVRNGFSTGFTSGGVNFASIKNCQIDSNSFTDCFGAAYTDSGTVEGLDVTNNTVIRGWQGVGIQSAFLPKQDINIVGNYFQIQNRNPIGANCGIVNGFGTTSNLTIHNNTIVFDQTGSGYAQYWGIMLQFMDNATVYNNTVGTISGYGVLGNGASGPGVIMFNNRTPAGALIPELNNQ
jgi:hypothetical protein